MADCIKLKQLSSILSKLDLSEHIFKKSTDSKRRAVEFDPSAIAKEDIRSIIFNGSEDAISRVKTAIGNSNHYDFMFGNPALSFSNDPSFDEFSALFKDDTPIQFSSNMIAISVIGNSLSSSFDLRKKLKRGSSDSDIDLINMVPENEISTLGLSEEIGRQVLLQNNIVVRTKVEDSARVHRLIGDSILSRLESKGILTNNALGSTLNSGLYDSNNELYRVPVIGSTPTISIHSPVLFGENKDTIRTPALNAANFIQKLTIPTSITRPSLEPSNFVSTKDIALPQSMKDVLSDMQEAPSFIDPYYAKLFRGISDDFKKQLESPSPVGLSRFLSDRGYDSLFGFADYKSFNYESDPSSELGKQQSRFYTVKELIVNFDDYFEHKGHGVYDGKPLHFTPEMYRTGRWQYLQTVFNPQTDAWFSRHILRPKKYKLHVGSSEYRQALNHLYAEGLNRDFISKSPLFYVDKKGKSKEQHSLAVTELVNASLVSFADGVFSASSPQAALAVLEKDELLKGKNAFEKMAYLRSFQEMLSSPDEDGFIHTGTTTSPDASASGMLLQLLYSLDAYNDAPARYLKRLEIIKSATPSIDALDDAYSILREAYDSLNIAGSTSNGEMHSFVDVLLSTGSFSTLRELLKIPTLATSYGAGFDAANQDISESVLESITSLPRKQRGELAEYFKESIPEILTDLSPDEETVVSSLNASSFAKEDAHDIISKYITSVFGDPILKELHDKFTGTVTATIRADNMKMYSGLVKAHRLIHGEESSLDIRVIPQYAWYLWKTSPTHNIFVRNRKKDGSVLSRYDLSIAKDRQDFAAKFGIPLTSSRMVIEKNKTLVPREVPNGVTSFVNVIHNTDASIQLLSHERTRKYFSDVINRNSSATPQERLDAQEALSSSIVNKHDSSGANALYNSIHQEMYRTIELDMVRHTDLREGLYYALTDLVELTPDITMKDIYRSFDIKQIKNMIKSSMEHRSRIVDPSFVSSHKPEKLYGDAKEDVQFDNDVTELSSVQKKINDKYWNNKRVISAVTETRTNNVSKKAAEAIGKLINNNDNIKMLFNTILGKKLLLSPVNTESIFKFVVNTDTGISPEYLPLSDGISLDPFAESYPRDISAADALAHEMAHVATASYIYYDMSKGSISPEIRFFQRIVRDLRTPARRTEFLDYVASIYDEETTGQVDDAMSYLLPFVDYRAISELTAIMIGEPKLGSIISESLDGFYGGHNDKTVGSVLTTFLDKIRSYLHSLFSSSVRLKDGSANVTSKNIESALATILQNGVKHRQNDSAHKRGLSLVDNPLGAGPTDAEFSSQTDSASSEIKLRYGVSIKNSNVDRSVISGLVNEMNSFLEHSLVNNIVGTKDSLVSKYGSKLDSALYHSSPLYRVQRDRVKDYWNSSPWLQDVKTFLFPERIGDVDTYYKLAGISLSATQDANALSHNLGYEMDKSFKKDKLSDADIAHLNHVLTSLPLHVVMERNASGQSILSEWLSNPNFDLNTESANIISSLRLSQSDVSRIQKAANIHAGTFDPHNIDDINIGSSYSPDFLFSTSTDAKTIGLKKLYMLESMSSINSLHSNNGSSSDFIGIMSKNHNSRTAIIDAMSGLIAQKNTIVSQYGGDALGGMNPSLLNESFKNKTHVVPVTEEDMKSGKYSKDTGYTILRTPTSNSIGLVYQNISIETLQEGIGTNLNFSKSDISYFRGRRSPITVGAVRSSHANSSELIVPLTYDEKKKLGLVEKPQDTLFRTYAHRMHILDTQVVRDSLLTKAFHKIIETTADMDAFESELDGSSGNDIKWTIEFGPAIQRSTVDDKTKYPNFHRLYSFPDAPLSNIRSFSARVDYVSNNANRMLFGYKDPVISEHNVPLRTYLLVHRGLAKMLKLRWTALKPSKIMRDLISNNVALMVLGVPMKRMIKYEKDAIRLLSEYNDLRAEFVSAKFNNVSARELATAKNQVERHPFHVMAQYGMLQSQNIDLIERDSDVLDGLESDIDKLIAKVTDNEDINHNFIAKGFHALMKFGLSTGDVLGFVGRNTKKIKALETLGYNLEESGKKLSEIRENDEVGSYIKEVFMTPGSEAVKWGTGATQLADIITRYTYFMSQIDDGVAVNDAVKKTLERFINYNIVPPKYMKMTDDYLVTAFSSYWSRIPRVLAAMGKESPANSAMFLYGHELVAGSFDIDIANIYDGNIVGKMMSGKSPLRNPYQGENIFDAVVPPPLGGLIDYLTR